MRRILLLILLPTLVAGCQTTTDPSEGGFIAGVSGITSGAYEQRVADREEDVAEAQARNESLAAQQSALAGQIRASESELASLKLKILQQRDALGTTDNATSARINQVLNAKPSGTTAEAQLASLQKTISQARALSADLAKLSG